MTLVHDQFWVDSKERETRAPGQNFNIWLLLHIEWIMKANKHDEVPTVTHGTRLLEGYGMS